MLESGAGDPHLVVFTAHKLNTPGPQAVQVLRSLQARPGMGKASCSKQTSVRIDQELRTKPDTVGA